MDRLHTCRVVRCEVDEAPYNVTRNFSAKGAAEETPLDSEDI